MFREILSSRIGPALLALPAVASLPAAANAYVGPGAGLTAIGTVIALVAAVLLAIVGFVWYPIKRLLAKRRTGEPNTSTGPVGKGSGE